MTNYDDNMKKLNRLFMKKFPDNSVYAMYDEEGRYSSAKNDYLFRLMSYYGFTDTTTDLSVRNYKYGKRMYGLVYNEYELHNTAILLELRSRKCKPNDKDAVHIWNDEYRQYGYIVWRWTGRGDEYIEELRTHFEHEVCEYLLTNDVKKYATRNDTDEK